jgi:hypothetical protein
MKVIDNPKASGKSAQPGKLDDIFGSLHLGRTWTQDMQTQEEVIAALDKALDNRYVMLRNVTLEGLEIPIPLVMVGPPGLRVIYPCATRGIFRAKGDVWEQMEDRQQVYRAASPNLLTRTELMGQAVAAFLAARGMPTVEIEPALFFSDPGTHVDSVRPAVRVVLVDGLERFIAGLVQSRAFLEKEDVTKIVDLFLQSMGVTERDISPYPDRDAFSFSDEPAEAKETVLDRIPRGEGVVKILNKIPFSGRQWFVLGFMVVVNIVILVAFVLLVLLTPT